MSETILRASSAIDGRAASRFRPDPAGLVFLGSLAFLACLQGPLLNDPDTQWHVAVGRDILSRRAVPWVDTYSHTFAGQPWIAKEWLSQVLLALAHALAGWAGVALLSALTVAATLGGLYAWLARWLDLVPALAATLLPAMLVAPHLLARPHVLALPVMLAWTLGLVTATERGGAPRWWLALAMMLWANLHAGFTIGFLIAGPLAVEAVAQAEAGRRARLAARWAGFLALALLASCATPYGARPLWITVTLFGSGEPLPYIAEWQPLALDSIGILAIGLTGLVLAALALRPRANVFRIALVAGLAAMTLRHSRFLDLLALMAPVIAAGPIARALPRLAAPTPHRIRPGATGYVITAGLGLVVLAAGLAADPRPDPGVTPSAALAAARAQALTTGRVYNAYDFGGFLIAERIATFIDGRSDQIFLGGFTDAARAAATAPEPGPLLALLARWDATWALVRADTNEARLFAAAPGWRAIHRDATAEVYERR